MLSNRRHPLLLVTLLLALGCDARPLADPSLENVGDPGCDDLRGCPDGGSDAIPPPTPDDDDDCDACDACAEPPPPLCPDNPDDDLCRSREEAMRRQWLRTCRPRSDQASRHPG